MILAHISLNSVGLDKSILDFISETSYFLLIKITIYIYIYVNIIYKQFQFS